MKKKIIIMLFAMIFALAGCAEEAEPTESVPTEPVLVIAAHEMTSLPASLDPLAEETDETALIRSFIAGKLYELSADGSQIIPSMAASLPVDVTAEYAGLEPYGVPANAVRGYAFRIDLSEAPCWEDGTPITAGDYLETLTQLLHDEAYAGAFSAIANAAGYLNEDFLPAAEVISLADSGIASVAEAQELGVTDFYLDVGTFWGVEADWLPLDDTTRLQDYAMPAGLDEQFVSAAWLYRQYLADGAPYDYLQSEFVGIPADMGAVLTIEDVGILKTGDYQLTFVFNTPMTADFLALELEKLELLNREDLSYGPYRVVSLGGSLIELERNENFWGDASAYPADIIRFRAAG